MTDEYKIGKDLETNGSGLVYARPTISILPEGKHKKVTTVLAISLSIWTHNKTATIQKHESLLFRLNFSVVSFRSPSLFYLLVHSRCRWF
jgi:hypothetical protein